MKKILFILGILLFTNATLMAQSKLDKSNLKAHYSASSSKKISDQITGDFLKDRLTLSAQQELGVSAALQSFFSKKASKVQQANYEQQKVILFESLKTELSEILNASQINLFMSLKPDVDDPNLLSIIFY